MFVLPVVAAKCVDFRPLNKCSGILRLAVISSPLRVTLRDDKSPDSVAGIGTADTNDIIKEKTSTTRPAREYCMIADQPIEK